MRIVIAWTKNGEEITAEDRVIAGLSQTQLARAARIVEGIGECDWDVRESSSPVVLTRKFGFNTGRGKVVKIHPVDEVFYASVERRGPRIVAPFVKGRKPEMSRSQTVILRPVGFGMGWTVVAAYIGEPTPPLPGDPFEYSAGDESREFWLRHALLEGAMPYRSGTEMADRPW